MTQKKQTRRNSQVRKTILTLLETSKTPLSAPDLVALLASLGLTVNKTTVYRELTILQEDNHIEPLFLSPGKIQYEIKSVHHHHFICQTCGSVVHMHDNGIESILDHYQKSINKRYAFSITKHQFELYGLCSKCK